MKKLFNALLILSVLAGVGFGVRDFVKKRQKENQSTSFHSGTTPDQQNTSSSKKESSSTDRTQDTRETAQDTSVDSSENQDTSQNTNKIGTDPSILSDSETSEDEVNSENNSSEKNEQTRNAESSNPETSGDSKTQNENPTNQNQSEGKKVAAREKKSDADESKKTSKSEPSYSKAAEKKAQSALEESSQLMAVARYEKAHSELNEVSSLDELRPKTAEKIRRARNKAVELQKVLYHDKIGIAPEERLEPVWVVVRMKDSGRSLKGLLLNESKRKIRLRKNTATYKPSKSGIQSMNKYSREATVDKLRERIKKEFEKFGPIESYVIDQFYDRAKKEFNNYLWEDGARTLSLAYEKKGNQLFEAFRDMRAKTVYRNYEFFMQEGQEKLAENKKDILLEKFPDHPLAKKLKGRKVAQNDRDKTKSLEEAFGPGEDSSDSGSSSEENKSSEGKGSETAKKTAGKGSGGISGQVNKKDFNIKISDYPSDARPHLKKAKKKYKKGLRHYEFASNDELDMSRRKKENRAAQTLISDTRQVLKKAMESTSGTDQDLKAFDRYLAELYGTCYRRAKMWGVY